MRFVLTLFFSGTMALIAQPVATVHIQRTPGGPAVPRDFVGLSVEQDIGLKYFGPQGNGNHVFFTLMGNIGPGTLRMGGNSEDYVCWTGAPDQNICSMTPTPYKLTNADFASWANASSLTGWPILLGVSLAQNAMPGAPQYILNEVKQGYLPIAAKFPKASLLGIETGNEINLYFLNPLYRPSSYNLTGQTSDLLSYMSVLKADPATQKIPIAAPAYYDPTQKTVIANVDTLVSNVTGCSGCSSNVGLVTLHEYPLTIAGDNVPTISQLLAPSVIQGSTQTFSQAVKDMQSKFGLAVQIGESGSVAVDPGQSGVSDVQAATLWELDYMLEMAKVGVRRMNFHIHDKSYYVPIQVNSTGPGNYSNLVMPTYYSLYAFGAARNQQFLPLSISTSANIRAYALSTCATCGVTVYLVNKDLSASGTVKIAMSSKGKAATYFELAAPTLSSFVQDVHYGGVQFDNSTGLLTGPVQTTAIQPDASGAYTVTLDNAAAGILTIQP